MIVSQVLVASLEEVGSLFPYEGERPQQDPCLARSLTGARSKVKA